MAIFKIPESNMELLEKKLTKIKKKCEKYNCDFIYKKLDEVYEEVEIDGKKVTIKFIVIDVQGKAEINDFEFMGVIEHTNSESGNIVRGLGEIAIPTKYFKTPPVCEHCNTLRRRKDTCLVYNRKTQEWKQVGKSCLRDYTNGLSAEDAVTYVSVLDTCANYSKFEMYNDFSYSDYCYIDLAEYLLYVVECVKHFGYKKASAEGVSTSVLARSLNAYYGLNNVMPLNKTEIRYIEKQIAGVDFKAESDENKAFVGKALQWIKENQDVSNEYIHNLKVVCENKKIKVKWLNLAASLIITYKKEVEKLKKQKEKQEQNKDTQYVGEIGQRIKVKIKSVKCIYSYYLEEFNQVNYIYEFRDLSDNILIWKTTKSLDVDEYNNAELTGTVKEHKEYKGKKQTVLLRCKIT